MKNRTTNNSSTANNSNGYSTSSVPSVKEVLAILLTSEAIHHFDIIARHQGKQHRLSETISKLRHKYGFGKLIQCPKEKDHPMRFKYFIAPGDIPTALKIAKEKNLLMEVK